MSGYLTVQTPGLPAQIAEAFQIQTSPVYGADGQFDGVSVTGAKLIGTHDESILRDALARVSDACRPGGIERATRAIAILKAMTASRPGEATDNAVAGAAYAAELASYPGDVIEEACRRYASENRWWPAWADLKRECDRMTAKRLAERTALQDALKPKPTPVYLGKPVPETREQRLRTSINAWLRNGRQDRAAPIERELARDEGREPEEWATPRPTEPSIIAERPPFKPDTSPTGKYLAEKAAQWRADEAAKWEAERAARKARGAA